MRPPGAKTNYRRNMLWRTFRAPLLIAVLSLTGLICALLVNGWIEVVASLMVAAPLLALLWMRWTR